MPKRISRETVVKACKHGHVPTKKTKEGIKYVECLDCKIERLEKEIDNLIIENEQKTQLLNMMADKSEEFGHPKKKVKRKRNAKS